MCFPSEESRPPSDILHSTVWNLTSLLLWPLFKWHQSFAEMISLRVLALLFFPLDTTSRTIWIKNVSLPIPPHPKAFVAIQVNDNKTSLFFCGLKGQYDEFHFSLYYHCLLSRRCWLCCPIYKVVIIHIDLCFRILSPSLHVSLAWFFFGFDSEFVTPG